MPIYSPLIRVDVFISFQTEDVDYQIRLSWRCRRDIRACLVDEIVVDICGVKTIYPKMNHLLKHAYVCEVTAVKVLKEVPISTHKLQQIFVHVKHILSLLVGILKLIIGLPLR